eukprot:403361272
MPQPKLKHETLNSYEVDENLSQNGAGRLNTQSSGSRQRMKKSVTFQIYEAKNLDSIKVKRQNLENQLDKFSKERELSLTIADSMKSKITSKIFQEGIGQSFNIQNLNKNASFGKVNESEINIFSGQSSINQRVLSPKQENSTIPTGKMFENILAHNKLDRQIKSSITELQSRGQHSNSPNNQSLGKLNSSNSSPQNRTSPQFKLNQLMGSRMTDKLQDLKDSHVENNLDYLRIQSNPQTVINSPQNSRLMLSLSQKAFETLKSRQSVYSPTSSMNPVKSLNKYSFQNINIFQQAVENSFLGQQSRDLVLGFQKFLDYNTFIYQIEEKCKARSQVNLMSQTIKNFKLALYNIKQYRLKVQKAYQFRKQRLAVFKKILIRKMRKIIYIEKQWLNRVKQEFKLQKKDHVLQVWKMFVKYNKVRRARKLNIYYDFMRKLQDRVEIQDQKLQEVQYILNKLKLKKIFTELKKYSQWSKTKKLNFRKILRLRKYILQHQIFKLLKQNQIEQKTIKNDIFLTKAFVKEDDFFEINVCTKSGLVNGFQDQFKNKSNFKITKQNLVNINLIQ